MTSVEQMLLANRQTEKRNVEKKHERFAISYMVDFDIIRAYKEVYDEDGDMDDTIARTAGSRLLRSVIVQRIIDREECNYIAKRRLEKETVILQIQRMYTNAMRDRDYASAKGALDMLCKHLGLYAVHNRQKKYSPEDVQAIKRKLEENGVSFDAPNKPISIETSLLVLNENSEVVKEGIQDDTITG